MNKSKREHIRSEDSSLLEYKDPWMSCSRHVERTSFLHLKGSSNQKKFFFLNQFNPLKNTLITTNLVK